MHSICIWFSNLEVIAYHHHCMQNFNVWADCFLSFLQAVFHEVSNGAWQLILSVHLKQLSVNQKNAPPQSLKILSSTLFWSCSMQVHLVWFGPRFQHQCCCCPVNQNRSCSSCACIIILWVWTTSSGMGWSSSSWTRAANSKKYEGRKPFPDNVHAVTGKCFLDQEGKLPDVVMDCNSFFGDIAIYDIFHHGSQYPMFCFRRTHRRPKIFTSSTHLMAWKIGRVVIPREWVILTGWKFPMTIPSDQWVALLLHASKNRCNLSDQLILYSSWCPHIKSTHSQYHQISA